MSPFNLKISTNIPLINKYLKKYTAFLNNFLVTESKREIYIESIHEGFVVFWQSISEFTKDFQPFSAKTMEKAKKLKSTENPFLTILPPKEEFPNEGVILTFEPNIEDFPTVKTVITNFFSPIDESIKFKYETPKIHVIFPTYESIISYLNPDYFYFSSKYDVFRK